MDINYAYINVASWINYVKYFVEPAARCEYHCT